MSHALHSRSRHRDESDWTPTRLFWSIILAMTALGAAIWILAIIGAIWLIGWLT